MASALYEAMMEDFIFMESTHVPDGAGGFVTEWTEGYPFKAALVSDTTIQARIAEKDGVTSVYTLTTSRSVAMRFHDVVKRVRDGAIFRITSNNDDKQSPIAGTLDIAQCSAERWNLT